jgi:hypothetical protein
MADDIKTDADKQRGKPGPTGKEVATSNEAEILNSIKESLIEQNIKAFGEGSTDTAIKEIGTQVLRIAEIQSTLLEATLEALQIDRDKLEGASTKSLDEGEERREMLNLFKDIRDSLKQSKGGVSATGASGKDGSDGGLGTGAMFGMGMMAKRIGRGVLGVGAGIAVILASFLAADKVATEYNIEGEGLKKVLINLGEGLEGFGNKGLAALAMILAAGVFGGARGGIGVGAIGLGLATFFTGLGASEKALAWMKTDYSTLPLVFKNFSESISALSAGALTTLGVLLGAGGIFGAKRAAMAGAGMAAMGAGIAGFFISLGAADKTMAWMDVDGTKLKTSVMNLTDTFGYIADNEKAMITLGGLLAVGAVFGQRPGAAAKGAVGMGIIGAGIGAFFAGLAMGDWALGSMGSDGGNLKAIMVNVAEGLQAFDGPALKGMLATGGIFAVASAIPGGMAVAGMAAVGLGIAGLGIGLFIAGLGVGGKLADLVGADGTGMKDILTNMAKGLQEFNNINGAALFETAEAMALLGPAMILLLTGKTVTAIGDAAAKVGGWLKSWVTDAEGPSQFETMALGLKAFEKLDNESMTQAAINVERLSNAVTQWGTMDSMKISKNAKAAVAQFEIMEKFLKGGQITQLNLEPAITFHGILNMDGVEESVAAFRDLAQNSAVVVPTIGAQFTAAGNPAAASSGPVIVTTDNSARSTSNNNTSNNNVQMMSQDKKTPNAIGTGGTTSNN